MQKMHVSIIWKQITRPILAFWSKTRNFISSSIHTRPMIKFPLSPPPLIEIQLTMYTRCITQVYIHRIEISITRESKAVGRNLFKDDLPPPFDRGTRGGGVRGSSFREGGRQGEAALLPITWRYASLKFIRRDSPIPTLAPHGLNEPRIIYL